jgi:hypothetical protein
MLLQNPQRIATDDGCVLASVTGKNNAGITRQVKQPLHVVNADRPGFVQHHEPPFVELPLPKFTWEAPYLVLTLYRNPAGALNELGPKVFARLNQLERKSWQFMVGRESVTSPELMAAMGFDERKAQRVLKKLLDVRLIRRVGKGRATRYMVVRP